MTPRRLWPRKRPSPGGVRFKTVGFDAFQDEVEFFRRRGGQVWVVRAGEGCCWRILANIHAAIFGTPVIRREHRNLLARLGCNPCSAGEGIRAARHVFGAAARRRNPTEPRRIPQTPAAAKIPRRRRTHRT